MIFRYLVKIASLPLRDTVILHTEQKDKHNHLSVRLCR